MLTTPWRLKVSRHVSMECLGALDTSDGKLFLISLKDGLSDRNNLKKGLFWMLV